MKNYKKPKQNKKHAIGNPSVGTAHCPLGSKNIQSKNIFQQALLAGVGDWLNRARSRLSATSRIFFTPDCSGL